ncbi:MAG TPA: redoxin domain-containing protein [Actinomycetota bacterium]|nr:redoxin domain-containing protein [Actinomycetota bacterium]
MSQFEAKREEFEALGAAIIGISTDSHYSHRAFAKKLGLGFLLLSDFNRSVVERLAGYFESVGGYRLVNRKRVLILDQKGVVRWAWTGGQPGEIPDTEEVRLAVEEVVYG